MFGGDESILLQRLLSHDPAAWQELVEKYSALLLAISRRTFAGYGYAASPHDCEDVVAVVWSNLLANEQRVLRQCHERRQLLPVLHVLTRHRTIDVMRRRKLPTQPLTDDHAEPAVETAPDLTNQLRQALTQLSAKERTLVELFYLQKKKYQEIELLTGIPQNSVGPTLTRALGKLRATLAKVLPHE